MVKLPFHHGVECVLWLAGATTIILRIIIPDELYIGIPGSIFILSGLVYFYRQIHRPWLPQLVNTLHFKVVFLSSFIMSICDVLTYYHETMGQLILNECIWTLTIAMMLLLDCLQHISLLTSFVFVFSAFFSAQIKTQRKKRVPSRVPPFSRTPRPPSPVYMPAPQNNCI